MLNRRSFISSAAALIAPKIAFASADTERRFIFIIQRGAADGLHTIIPYAEPAYAKLRGPLAMDIDKMLKLDGTFALHSSLSNIAELYKTRQANLFHAVASPYRDRSHFDAQNVLESGGNAPFQIKDGWMNRLASMLPRRDNQAIAFAPTLPLAMRGSIEVASYSPSVLPHTNEDLFLRISQLYEGDPQLRALWTTSVKAQNIAGSIAKGKGQRTAADLGKVAAGFLARVDGPRIAMIETDGWDTHSSQNTRMAVQLKNLDELINALKLGLGDAWTQTTILIATEFGRTVAANGTGGTDHGTASAAMLLGGAVKGGRIITDWPGLAPNNLLENRDLRPTLGIDSLVVYACSEAFKLDVERTAQVLFPSLRPGIKLSTLLYR